MVYFHLSLHSSHAAFSSQNSLQSEGFSDDAALDQAIKKLEADLKKTRKKAANDSDDVIVSTLFFPSREVDRLLLQQEEPSFPLVDTPDDQVTCTLPR